MNTTGAALQFQLKMGLTRSESGRRETNLGHPYPDHSEIILTPAIRFPDVPVEEKRGF